MLIDKGMKKGELQERAEITASIMARLAKDETVRTDTIGKICKALDCQPGDIMEYIDDDKLTSKSILDENIIETFYNMYDVYHDEISYFRFKQILLKCAKKSITGTVKIDESKLNGLLKEEAARVLLEKENKKKE